MANILQCNVFLSIVRYVVMDRALDARSRSFTESHLQKVTSSVDLYKHMSLYIYIYVYLCFLGAASVGFCHTRGAQRPLSVPYLL